MPRPKLIPDPAAVAPVVEPMAAWSVLLEDPFGPPPPPPAPPPPPFPDASKRKFTLGAKLAEGDLCDVFWYTAEGNPKIDAVLKVARSSEDNDLVMHEARILSKLFPEKQGDEKFYRYLPKLLDAFLMEDDTGPARRANVFPRLKEYRGLDEVLTAHPKGLDFLDTLWIFKRCLAGVGFAHFQGFVHAALVPTHLMVDPVGHGAKLIDWSYAVEIANGEKVKAISPAYRNYYAPEILAKEAVSSATDIYMIAKCIIALLGGDVVTHTVPDTVPTPYADFIRRCLVFDRAARPSDAWQLHKDLDLLLGDRMKIKPKYRLLDMPPRV